MRATYVICAVLVATVAAQPMGVLVPPHNWRYTVGDASCTKAHCAVTYELDMDTCSCGASQTVPRVIQSCMPHCGNTCHQCELLYPATKKMACGRQACTMEEWAAQQIDCELSQWSGWSECSKPCEDKFGPGLQFREQSIIQHARNRPACPSAAQRYQERPCNNVTCTEPIECHANPYCAGAMETCQNVACRVVQHQTDGEHGAKYPVDCTDDGYGSVTCVDPGTQQPVNDVHFLPTDPDHENCTTVTQWDTSGSTLAVRDGKKRTKATHRNNCAGGWYRASGTYHIETSHRSWDPADNQTSHDISGWSNSAGVAPFPNHNATHAHRPKPQYGERDGAKHFCKIHYPFGLRAPECKCMCIGEEQAVQTCNHDRTKCFLTASPGLQKEIDDQSTGFTGTADPSTVSQHFPNWGPGQNYKLSDSVQPMVVKHAQNLVEIKGHSDGIYNTIDLNVAKQERTL